MTPVLLPLALGAGCIFRVNVESEPIEVDEAFSAVQIELDAGEVRLLGDPDATGASGEATLEWHQKRPELEVAVVGDTLTIDARCRSIWHHCVVDLDLVLPEGVSVMVDSGAGDVTVQQVLGDLDLQTGAGDVAIQGAAATVFASTGAGDISGTALLADEFDAETGAGRIDLVHEGSFSRLVAGSGAGDIDLLVPSGTYAVLAESGVGEVSVTGIATSPGAQSRIEANTGAGDIRIVGYAASH